MAPSSSRNCLSVPEMMELKRRERDPASEKHASECARCRGLLAALPAPIDDSLGQVPMPATAPDPTATFDHAGTYRTGDLWAAALDANWRVVVAVIGRRPGDASVLVAPISPETTMAAEGDVVRDSSPLGYPIVVSIWNHGPVEEDQLDEYLGRLERPAREQIAGAFRALTFERPYLGAEVPPVLGEHDARLLWRDEQRERMLPLFARVNARIDDMATDAARGELLTVSTILSRALEADWDRVSLLESAQVDGSHFNNFLKDQLDLQTCGDVEEVARVLTLVMGGTDEVEPVVAQSLAESRGGEWEATGSPQRLAASSYADVSEEERKRALFRGISRVDASEEGRRRAIDRYLRELRTALDQL